MATIFLYLNASAHFGQDTLPYRLQHFDNSSGLPQNSVNAIASDRLGYIWLATESGLVRYDGRHFQIHVPSIQTTINHRFFHIFNGHNGELLTMNYSNVVMRIDDGKIFPDSSLPLSARDYTGWEISRNNGDAEIAYDVRLPNRIMNWESTLTSFQLQGSRGRRFIFRNDTLSMERKGEGNIRYPFRNKGSWNFFLLGDSLYFLRDDGRTVHFGSSMEVSAFSGDILRDPAFIRHPGKTQVFWNRVQDREVLLYIGKSFYRATPNGSGLYTRRIFSGFDIVANTISTAYYDKEKGKLYLGSATHGLFILTEQRFATRHTPENNNSHYSLLPFDSNLVMSANGYFLGLGQPVARPIPYWDPILSDFYSVSPDGEQGFWTKGYKNIYHYNKKPIRKNGQWEMPAKVTMLYTDKRKRLWIGLQKAKGVWVMDGSDPQKAPNKKVNTWMDPTCFAEDGNQMYIGANRGLYIYDMQTGRLDSLAGLAGRYVRNAKVVAPGEVWITTYGHGFYVYRNNHLSAFPLDNEQFLSYAHCISLDRHGYFWIPTNTGLFQMRRKDLMDYITDTTRLPYYHYYDKSDGMATNEFNGGCQPCAATLGNGYNAMPSLNGVVFFHPDSIHPVLPSQPVFLDAVMLGNREMAADSLIRLPENFNSLQLAFSTPYMGNPKNLHLQYALLRTRESDTIWNELPEDGHVMLSTLPSGGYNLTVRKHNGFGLGNYAYKSIRLHVAAPWYESRWFYALLLLLGIGGTLLLARIREMYMNRKNAMLKKLVDEKTQELKSNSALQDKIIQSVGHNVLTPLKYQYFLSRKIHELTVKEGASFTEMARVMNDHTNYLYHMVDNLLKYLKSQIADRQVADSLFEPVVTADAVLKIFQDIAKEKSTALVNNIPEAMQLYGDELLLSVILHNLADNAVKVTRNGQIVLDARSHNSGVVLSVKDTGPGMRTDIVQWFNAAEVRDYPGAGGGIGLLIVKELAQNMGLHVAIVSEEGKGSEFTIWFPDQEERH